MGFISRGRSEMVEIEEIAEIARESRDSERQFKRQQRKMRALVKEQPSYQLVLKLGLTTSEYFELELEEQDFRVR